MKGKRAYNTISYKGSSAKKFDKMRILKVNRRKFRHIWILVVQLKFHMWICRKIFSLKEKRQK